MDMPRYLYRLLLKLHPRGFRGEFESEMLWIFDELRAQGNSKRCFADCLSSLVRQHAKAEDYTERRGGGFGTEISGFELTFFPLLRATLFVSLLLVGFTSALGHFTPMTFPSSSWPAPRIYRPSCEDLIGPSRPAHRAHSAHSREERERPVLRSSEVYTDKVRTAKAARSRVLGRSLPNVGRGQIR